MKQLFILRHGEAGFSEGLDFKRQLTEKGRENLKRMGETLQTRNLEVDFMYCSAAQRTRETADILGNYLAIQDSIYLREIYDGDLAHLLALLEKNHRSVNSCLLVGHNPTLSLLLAQLTGEPYFGLQPGMLAIVELDINEWNMVGVNTGLLKEVVQ